MLQTLHPVSAVFWNEFVFILFPLTVVICSCGRALLGSTLLANALAHDADM